MLKHFSIISIALDIGYTDGVSCDEMISLKYIFGFSHENTNHPFVILYSLS